MNYQLNDKDVRNIRYLDTFIKEYKSLKPEEDQDRKTEIFFLKEINTIFTELGMNFYFAMREQLKEKSK